MEWYVLFVQTGKEKAIQEWIEFFLDSNSYISFVPTKLIYEKRNGINEKKEKVLFPGYVFLNVDLSNRNYNKIKEIPIFKKLLKTGDYFSCINDHEINPILTLTNSDYIIDFSKIVYNNSAIHIVEGPLKGMEHLVKKIDKRKRRATIELQLLNEIRLINLGIEFI